VKGFFPSIDRDPSPQPSPTRGEGIFLTIVFLILFSICCPMRKCEIYTRLHIGSKIEIDPGRDGLIMAWHRSNQTSKRLHYIPGVGPMPATALVAIVADPRTFRSGRNFSAWVGLVPKQHSSVGKDRLGSISKQGDRYLRSLFVAGALAVNHRDCPRVPPNGRPTSFVMTGPQVRVLFAAHC
jgi:hypothetical protein